MNEQSQHQQAVFPTILVVTPSYNHAKYIRSTIESVLSQDYKYFEYKIIDGHSSDGTVTLLREYEGRLSWISERDNGYADAVRKGFMGAEADYLIWLPSDDTFKDDQVLSRFANEIMTNAAEVVYGDSVYVDADGNITGKYATAEFSPDFLRRNCFICQPSTIFSRQIYQQVGGIDARWKSIADYDLWLRFADAGARFHHLAAVQSRYRLHSESITVSKKGRTYKEIFELMLERYRRVEEDWICGALVEIIPVSGFGRFAYRILIRYHRSLFIQKTIYGYLKLMFP